MRLQGQGQGQGQGEGRSTFASSMAFLVAMAAVLASMTS